MELIKKEPQAIIDMQSGSDGASTAVDKKFDSGEASVIARTRSGSDEAFGVAGTKFGLAEASVITDKQFDLDSDFNLVWHECLMVDSYFLTFN